MNSTLLVLATISALFVVLLIVKAVTKWRICAICASVALTWIPLLFMYRSGAFPYPVIIALLLGESVVGTYYAVERRAKGNLLLFRLPFLLTETLVALLLMDAAPEPWLPITFLAVLWVIFGVIHVYRSNPRIKAVVDRLVACCRQW